MILVKDEMDDRYNYRHLELTKLERYGLLLLKKKKRGLMKPGPTASLSAT